MKLGGGCVGRPGRVRGESGWWRDFIICLFGISKEQEKRCKTEFSPFGTMRSEGDIPSEHIGGPPWGPQRHSIAFRPMQVTLPPGEI